MTGLMLPQFWSEAEMMGGRRRPAESGRALVAWLIGRKAKAARPDRRVLTKETPPAPAPYPDALW